MLVGISGIFKLAYKSEPKDGKITYARLQTLDTARVVEVSMSSMSLFNGLAVGDVVKISGKANYSIFHNRQSGQDNHTFSLHDDVKVTVQKMVFSAA